MSPSNANKVWHIVHANVAGTKHEKAGRPSDDVVAVYELDDGSVIAAVSDGAGSALFGRQGAEWATQAAANWLASQVAIKRQDPLRPSTLHAILLTALQRAHDTIERLSQSYKELPVPNETSNVPQQLQVEDTKTSSIDQLGAEEISALDRSKLERRQPAGKRNRVGCNKFHKNSHSPPKSISESATRHHSEHIESLEPDLPRYGRRDFACTLLLAAITPSYAGFMQVGDGFVIGARDDKLQLLTQPQKGEYINLTTFVTSASYVTKVSSKFTDTPSLQGIALMSDGLEGVFVQRQTWRIFEDTLRPFFEFARDGRVADHNAELDLWLRSEKVCNLTDDDKSVIFIVPQSR